MLRGTFMSTPRNLSEKAVQRRIFIWFAFFCKFHSFSLLPPSSSYQANALTRGNLDEEAANEMIQESVSASTCPQCAHDYDVRCPTACQLEAFAPLTGKLSHWWLACFMQGWSANAGGNACEAPEEYQGPCALQLFVHALSAREKALLETRRASYRLYSKAPIRLCRQIDVQVLGVLAVCCFHLMRLCGCKSEERPGAPHNLKSRSSNFQCALCAVRGGFEMQCAEDSLRSCEAPRFLLLALSSFNQHGFPGWSCKFLACLVLLFVCWALL